LSIFLSAFVCREKTRVVIDSPASAESNEVLYIRRQKFLGSENTK
jgi:hypothetical protein